MTQTTQEGNKTSVHMTQTTQEGNKTSVHMTQTTQEWNKTSVHMTQTKQEGNKIPLFEKRGQTQVPRKPATGWDRLKPAVSVVSPVLPKSIEEPTQQPDIELVTAG
jgi:hypothetical protein